MFVAGGVLSTVFRDVSFTMVVYGENAFWAIFRCNTTRGNWKKMEAQLSSGTVSRFYNTSMIFCPC